MSAELIVHWAWVKPGGAVNWQAAHDAIDSLTDDELDDYADRAAGTDAEGMGGADVVRQEIQDAINTLTDADMVVLQSPSGDVAHLAGGTSYGDDPNEEYAAFSNLSVLPVMFDAAGFLT